MLSREKLREVVGQIKLQSRSVGGAVARLSKAQRLILAILLAGILVGGCLLAASFHGRNPRQVDFSPISVDADEIVIWKENNQSIMILRGRVLIQQGTVTARFEEGVAWVEIRNNAGRSIKSIDIHAEKDVSLVEGSERSNPSKAYLQLQTSGQLHIRSYKHKVQQVKQPPSDSFYLRVAKERRKRLGQSEAPAQPPAGLPTASPSRPTMNSSQSPQFAKPETASGNSLQPTSYTPSAQSPVPSDQASSIPTTTPPVASGSATTDATPSTPDLGKGNTKLVQLPGNAMQPPPVAPFAPGPNMTSPPPQPESSTLPSPRPVPRPANVPPPPTAIPPGTSATFRPKGSPSEFWVQPRGSSPVNWKTVPLNGQTAYIFTGGIILLIRSEGTSSSKDQKKPTPTRIVDIEADQLVLWTRGPLHQQFLHNMQASQRQKSRDMEFYLSGNVVLRHQSGKDEHLLRADELYYDANRNVAVAISADLQFSQPKLPQPIHIQADELEQLSPQLFKALHGQVFSSQLPANPGLKTTFTEATLEQKDIPRQTFYGKQILDPTTQQPIIERHSFIETWNSVPRIEDVPVFYMPYSYTDAKNPLGPLQSINVGWNRIFGYQAGVTLDAYSLFGLYPQPSTRWRVMADYMSARGPMLSTQYDYAGTTFFGLPSKYSGKFFLVGEYDNGDDILGGWRNGIPHTPWRGRLFWDQNVQDLPEGFSWQGKVSAMSDKNFLEQYWKQEFDQDPNQETYVYGKQQQDNWAWSAWVKPNIRNWMTETQWLPRVDGYWLGESIGNILTYNSHASAGFAIFRPTQSGPPPISVTDTQNVQTDRLDWMQDLSMPLNLGALHIVPYGRVDVTQYSQDLTGQPLSRYYYAGGIRSSIQASKLFPNIQSELWNLNGLNHKIVFTGNYYAAHSSEPYFRFAQLDRLNDDATDQSLRDIAPLEQSLNPLNGSTLVYSPLYQPQTYAIRQLLMNNVDTLGTIEEFQADIRQRWQTKRGYPGQQHIVDWMTLDTSATFFPHPQRDDFGSSVAFIQYNWDWNVGDRTALVSTGWFDPIQNGARVWTVGSYFNRPDRTNIYLGYRQLDPINSKLVTGAVNYVFSPKYAITAAVNYDVAAQVQTNSLIFTRIGSDLLVSLGFSYNSTTQNFNFMFEIVPNIVPASRFMPGLAGLNNSTIMQR